MQAPTPTASPDASADAAPTARPTARARPTASVEMVPPPPGLARGRYETPPWTVVALAVTLCVGVVAFFVARHRRAKKARGYDSVAPNSGPMSRR